MLHGFLHGHRGADLAALLHHAVVLARRGHNLLGLENIVRAGLFDVHVLAGLAGPDGHQGVPVIGRGDGDGVDGFVFQQLADVLVGLRLGLAELVDLRQALGDVRIVDIADRRDLHVGQLAVAADVGRRRGRRCRCRRCERCRWACRTHWMRRQGPQPNSLRKFRRSMDPPGNAIRTSVIRRGESGSPDVTVIPLNLPHFVVCPPERPPGSPPPAPSAVRALRGWPRRCAASPGSCAPCSSGLPAAGGSTESTSRPAPAMRPAFSASARSWSTTSGPRDVLIRNGRGLHQREGARVDHAARFRETAASAGSPRRLRAALLPTSAQRKPV